jgi:hypothetical protein
MVQWALLLVESTILFWYHIVSSHDCGGVSVNGDGCGGGGYYYYYYYYYIISFMHGIQTYIPETNHVSRVYSVATILRVLLMVRVTLSSILNSFVLLH